MTKASQRNRTSQRNRNRWLIAIGALKLLKAVLFISMGFGVIKMVHKDVGDILLHLTRGFGFDPENRAVNLLLEKAVLLNPHRLREISDVLFLYAGLDIVEGTGLVLEKIWAEYFTLILTTCFLPWEFYEIIRHLTAFKVGLSLLNVFVVVYLAIIVKERMREREALRLSG